MSGRSWVYRIVGASLAWVVVALNGVNVGLLWVGRDADGFDALGAAIWGFLWGAVLGLVAAVLFGAARPPPRPLHRWLILASLAALALLSLALQEMLD